MQFQSIRFAGVSI